MLSPCGSTSRTGVVLRQVERLERRPVAGAELGPRFEKERDVDAEPRCESREIGRAGGCASSSHASLIAVAASVLPPPSPAATGIRFSIRARQLGSTPLAAATASRARRTIVSSAKPSTESSAAGSNETVSQRSMR